MGIADELKRSHTNVLEAIEGLSEEELEREYNRQMVGPRCAPAHGHVGWRGPEGAGGLAHRQ